jgi:hypothetical protein
MKNTVIVTKHKALQAYIIELGLADETTPIYSSVTAVDIAERDVVGLLPIRLAQFARTYTEIPLVLDKTFHGKEMTIEQVRMFAQEPQKYMVIAVGNPEKEGL